MNNKNFKCYYLTILSVGCILMYSCQKRDDFLSKKPDSHLVVPSTLSDLQQLLDNNQHVMNQTPSLGEISADDYYVTEAAYNTLPLQEQNAYIWNKDIFGGMTMVADYNIPYQQVLVCNIVLGELNKIPIQESNRISWNNIKGTALFDRAFAFYNLTQVYAPVYDSLTSNIDLGIPLRLNADANQSSVRSTVQQTYDQIISDLIASENLVQKDVNNYRNRPSKPVVYAMLARVYLSMRKYDKAYLYADSCLKLYNKLIDYNFIDTNSRVPFPRLNDESIFDAKAISSNTTIFIGLRQGYSVDTTLYASYSLDDLRRSIFFIRKGTSINLKAGYNGIIAAIRYTGLAIDEVYLIRAECSVRNGNIEGGMNDLNTLLRNRFLQGTFSDLKASNVQGALDLILEERRKELIMRNTRWTDLRRLNKEGFHISLTRKLNDQVYTLPPNDPRYVLPFPGDVISLSGMPQNNR